MNDETAMQAHQDNGAMSVDDMKRQVGLIQQVMKEVMKKGEHYGVVPGCGDKPTLLKPGSEKIMMVFRLAPEYKVTRYDLPGGHREYEVITTLRHIETGRVVGEGLGCCTSMEGKFRFRKVRGERVEHDSPADYYNTIMKMAKKRSQSDAVLTATAASDIFTQDIEDMPEVFGGDEGKGGGNDPINQPSRKTGMITEKQQKRLYAIAKGAKWSNEELNAMLKSAFEIDGLDGVTVDKHTAVEEVIKNGPRGD